MMTYATPILRFVAATHIQKLQVLQNKMIKMALNVPFFTSTKFIHEISNIETIKEFIAKTTEKPPINKDCKIISN